LLFFDVGAWRDTMIFCVGHLRDAGPI